MKSLVVKDLRVSYRGKYILDGINLDVDAGEVILVKGPSGSGKSTLLKSICGLIPYLYQGFKLEGTIRVLGYSPLDALRRKIVTYVPQEVSNYFMTFTLNDELSILGVNNGHELISELGLESVCGRTFYELSDGERYKALIALALLQGVKVLLLDEPTTHLDPWVLTDFMHYVRDLALDRELTVVVVDHRYEVLKKYIDRVYELSQTVCADLGEVLGTIALVKDCLRSDDMYMLKIKDLWFRYDSCFDWLLRGIDLIVRRGEVISIVGRNGVGKTTLLKLMAGILRPNRGVIKRYGRVFYIPQEPIYWFSKGSVRDELADHIDIFNARVSIDALAKIFGLSKCLVKNPYSLSVGEARRLSLAISYISNADLIIMDEPTLGLDECSLRVLEVVIKKLRDLGKSFVIATHDLKFAKRVSNHVLIMEGGSLRWLN